MGLCLPHSELAHLVKTVWFFLGICVFKPLRIMLSMMFARHDVFSCRIGTNKSNNKVQHAQQGDQPC
jgi:hypothetical protein